MRLGPTEVIGDLFGHSNLSYGHSCLNECRKDHNEECLIRLKCGLESKVGKHVIKVPAQLNMEGKALPEWLRDYNIDKRGLYRIGNTAILLVEQ